MKPRRNLANLIDVREERVYHCSDMDLRDATDNADELILTGYASTFQPYEMYGGPAAYGWIEQLDRNAFDKTLREGPDLHLLINHGGMPLARTKSGTLNLSVDDGGLKVEARLDRSDPDVQRLEPKMRRGDMDEMSFAFRVKAQEWSVAPGFEDLEDDQTYRKITEVSLHKGDVSVVNFGANPTTHAEVKSIPAALKVLASAGADDLAELRSDESLLTQVVESLSKLSEPVEVAPVVGVENAPTVTIENCNVEAKSKKKKKAEQRAEIRMIDVETVELRDADGVVFTVPMTWIKPSEILTEENAPDEERFVEIFLDNDSFPALIGRLEPGWKEDRYKVILTDEHVTTLRTWMSSTETVKQDSVEEEREEEKDEHQNDPQEERKSGLSLRLAAALAEED